MFRLSFLIVALIALGSVAYADSAKDDLNQAGQDTSNAAKNTGHAISKGAKNTKNKAGQAGKDVARKSKKSAHDLKQDVSSG